MSEGGIDSQDSAERESAEGGESLLSSSGHQVGVEPSNGRPNRNFGHFFLRRSASADHCPLSFTLSNSVGTVFAGAFAFGIGFDVVTQRLWKNHNRGVSMVSR